MQYNKYIKFTIIYNIIKLNINLFIFMKMRIQNIEVFLFLVQHFSVVNTRKRTCEMNLEDG